MFNPNIPKFSRFTRQRKWKLGKLHVVASEKNPTVSLATTAVAMLGSDLCQGLLDKW